MANTTRTPQEKLQRIAERVKEETFLAWRIQNLLAFMAEAMLDDLADSLPVKCALINLRDDANRLAENLMDLVGKVENEA